MIFSEDEVMLIKGWDQPLAVAKADEYWEPFVPEFRLVAPYRRAAKAAAKKVSKKPLQTTEHAQLEFKLWDAKTDNPSSPVSPSTPKNTPLTQQRKRAFDSFRFSLPKEIAKTLERFRSHQWPLLVLLAHDKRVLDIATTNPVLAYAVAGWYANYPRSRLKFGRMPQRNLLKLLKLPDSAALVKLFRKIPPESMDPKVLKRLLSALRKPDSESSKLLRHVSSINRGVMELILTPHIRPILTPTMLEEVAADPRQNYRAETASMIRDIVWMKEELADDHPLRSMKSVASLRLKHEEISADFQKLEKLRKIHGVLPKPPLPGIEDHIIPLETQADLVTEGREQSNCVASYTANVVDRKCYIYRIIHPSRATLRIHRQIDGNWGISEIKASCNREVPHETRVFVKQWLDPYRIGI